MRRVLVSLMLVIAATATTPIGASADLTSQVQATLTCSDGHSVNVALDQAQLTNLLGQVQAINTSGLMACTVSTDASSETAKWTVYDYNPSNQEIAPRNSPRSMPATTTGATTTFNFKDGVYTALLTTTDPALTGNLTGRSLQDTISVSGSATSFKTQRAGGDCVNDVPATVRFYFRSPSASGSSVGTPPAGFYTQYWWSNPISLHLLVNTETAVITADLANPGEWSDWNGQSGANPAVTEAFFEAVQKVQAIGLSFGGDCFFETGVTAVNNPDNTEQFSSTFGES